MPASATSLAGVRGHSRSPGLNGVKSCILAISWEQNWPFKNSFTTECTSYKHPHHVKL
jgi:hypothetical protein